eukprot:16452368-Heterocapsa_arctica.AAC.3
MIHASASHGQPDAEDTSVLIWRRHSGNWSVLGHADNLMLSASLVLDLGGDGDLDLRARRRLALRALRSSSAFRSSSELDGSSSSGSGADLSRLLL